MQQRLVLGLKINSLQNFVRRHRREGSRQWVSEIKTALNKADAGRHVNKAFVAAADSSAGKMQRRRWEEDEEVLMSSWAKEGRLMKWWRGSEVLTE